ncbi:MAG: ABC transporter permease [Acidobacteria bacterium]|nr:ABC transporter permease [Acidobacteriota bacterium]
MSPPRSAARGASATLALILAVAAAAPWLAPGPPEEQEDVAGARYLPPLTRAHAVHLEPHGTRIVTALRPRGDGWEFRRAGSRGWIPTDRVHGHPEPRFYLLGTDGLGRDLTSRLLFAARHSISVAAMSVALALLLGVGLGSAAALAGGWWDAALMRGVDMLMSIPRLLIYLVCAALVRPSTLFLVLVVGATTWTGLARLVRAEMMKLRHSDLALAARAAGVPAPRILLRHLLPHIGPLLVVTVALRFADTVLLESALSFLGLGAPPPAVSLGGIMASGRDALADAWWIVAWPGILISALLLSIRSTAADLFRLPESPSLP